MQKWLSLKFEVPTYQFVVHKNFVTSSPMVMFKFHYSQIHVVIPCHYFSPQWFFSNGLLSDPNGDHIQNLCRQEANVPTNKFGFTILLVLHILGSCLGYTIGKGMVSSLFTIVLLYDSSPMVSSVTQMKIVYRSYDLTILTLKLTTLGFKQLFPFNLIGSCFRYTIAKNHGLVPLYYFSPQWYLCNNLSSDTKKYSMQDLRREEVYLQTYHFGVHKTFYIS